MKMQLISLMLENFKGHECLALRFDGQDGSIYGENGTGKSSVYDGLTWLLFGKDGHYLGGGGAAGGRGAAQAQAHLLRGVEH